MAAAKEEQSAPQPKLSLSKALTSLAEVLAISEEGLLNDDEAIRSCLALADSNLVYSVDRRIGLVVALTGGTLSLDAAKGLISSLKEREAAVKKERQFLEKILISVKESTLQLMEEFNQDFLKGENGEFKKLKGLPSLECDKRVYQKSYSNLVASDDLAGIPAEYLIHEQIITLNKELLKENLLKKGVELPWARITYNPQLKMKHTLSLAGR